MQEILLPLSLGGGAEPAPLTRGATAWLKFLDLCVDEKRQEMVETMHSVFGGKLPVQLRLCQ